MASVLVQFRTDDKRKKEATEICETLGIELSDYLRMCMSRLILERGLPFSMKEDDIIAMRAINAMYEISEEAKRNGTANLTLQEINEEIEKVREELKKR